MKSVQTIYKFGNLYDKATLKRILIDDGAEIIIHLQQSDLLDVDPNIKPETILDSGQKETEIKNFLGKSDKWGYWKLLSASYKLYFGITAGVRSKKATEKFKCLFQVRLLEDLYIYNKKKEPKYARFFECHCLVENCLGDFKFFEPLYATSLNDAYTKTYELYFAMFAKSTGNAFDRFYENPDLKTAIRGKTESIQKEK